MKYIRTCQECGHKQEAKPPSEYKSEAWRNTKCKRCKSEALDYGKEVSDTPNEDDEEEE